MKSLRKISCHGNLRFPILHPHEHFIRYYDVQGKVKINFRSESYPNLHIFNASLWHLLSAFLGRYY